MTIGATVVYNFHRHILYIILGAITFAAAVIIMIDECTEYKWDLSTSAQDTLIDYLLTLTMRVPCGAKEYKRVNYTTSEEMLAAVWNTEIDNETKGYILCLASEDREKFPTGHACGFIKFQDRGYVMLPGDGLSRVKSLEALKECLIYDAVCEAWEDVPCKGELYSIKW